MVIDNVSSRGEGIMVKTPDGTIYERGEKGFDNAWVTLAKAGYQLSAWMYMETYPDGFHAFKNIMTRKYISVS